MDANLSITTGTIEMHIFVQSLPVYTDVTLERFLTPVVSPTIAKVDATKTPKMQLIKLHHCQQAIEGSDWTLTTRIWKCKTQVKL